MLLSLRRECNGGLNIQYSTTCKNSLLACRDLSTRLMRLHAEWRHNHHITGSKYCTFRSVLTHCSQLWANFPSVCIVKWFVVWAIKNSKDEQFSRKLELRNSSSSCCDAAFFLCNRWASCDLAWTTLFTKGELIRKGALFLVFSSISSYVPWNVSLYKARLSLLLQKLLLLLVKLFADRAGLRRKIIENQYS